MTADQQRPVILVIEDVEETREGIERLLTASGYQVSTARNEDEAIQNATYRQPDLILISLGLDASQIFLFAKRLRNAAELSQDVPVVAFSVASLDEGDEVRAGYNLYMTRPENFDQIRVLIARILRELPRSA
jgi:CheY-like chemotaxis protein